jgi:hypothetical protein
MFNLKFVFLGKYFLKRKQEKKWKKGKNGCPTLQGLAPIFILII